MGFILRNFLVIKGKISGLKKEKRRPLASAKILGLYIVSIATLLCCYANHVP